MFNSREETIVQSVSREKLTGVYNPWCFKQIASIDNFLQFLKINVPIRYVPKFETYCVH